MAERLGTGLQNLLQRFDSASHLHPSNTPEITFPFPGNSSIVSLHYLLHNREQRLTPLPLSLLWRLASGRKARKPDVLHVEKIFKVILKSLKINLLFSLKMTILYMDLEVEMLWKCL